MPSTETTPARRRPALIVAVVLALLIGIGSWRLLAGADPEASADEVVSDFFQAQREGDCERLLELLSEASWSDDGDRSRDEFLGQCTDVIAGYEPPRDRFTVVDADDPDQALVEFVGVYYENDAAAGRLVREDSEWKVETDELTLRIGPPADEAVRGYLEAYRAGDCEAITTYVAEETWSENGRLGRDEFLTRCESLDDARDTSLATGLAANSVSVSHYGTGDARATMALPGLHFQRAEQFWLHQEGLRWMVRGEEDPARHSSPGTYLRSLRLAELQELLVRRPTLDRPSCHDHFDTVTRSSDLVHTGMPRAPRGVHADIAVTRDFSSCDGAVTLYEFAGADAARTAAERLAGELIGERPDREIDIAGHPTAIGVRTTVFLAHRHRVIGAHSALGDLDAAVELLAAQLREL